jgi:hypothetical protein
LGEAEGAGAMPALSIWGRFFDQTTSKQSAFGSEYTSDGTLWKLHHTVAFYNDSVFKSGTFDR